MVQTTESIHASSVTLTVFMRTNTLEDVDRIMAILFGVCGNGQPEDVMRLLGLPPGTCPEALNALDDAFSVVEFVRADAAVYQDEETFLGAIARKAHVAA